MIRLCIADDHTLMREGLKQLFVLIPDLVVVAEATQGGDVLDCLRRERVDLLLLDMSMPGISGEDLIGRVRSHHPQLPILILSMHNEPLVAQRAFKAGANGYVSKDADPETLVSAMRRVAGGGRYIEPGMAERMAFASAGLAADARHDKLSDRELQVLRLLARGLGVNDIADQLAISNKTVSTHKARMMEKMGFANNADMLRYAMTHGLAD
ncbi:MAG: response regulator transcription factor [Pseudomonadota bacterium]